MKKKPGKKKEKKDEAKKKMKILILGSGALKIGEAGEFDYSGSQCIKALKEEGITTILINPNIATIQTSEYLADKIYFLPIKPSYVEEVIKKEHPNGILLSFGGQTALNCGVELHDQGILDKYGVKVLGTQVQTIKDTEDRDLFVKKLAEIDIKVPKSKAVSTVEDAQKAARMIGYPIMMRVAYALGGRGSGIIQNQSHLIAQAKKAFSFTNQILIEECLVGWKEIEYEVVRDKADNCITVCNMENVDPMGIHTGESIVVAPVQTLNNHEVQLLRDVSIKTIRHLGIVGECNIQFALSPDSDDYRVIEVNARLSRSSALASKATGYPLAFVAAKLSLGQLLPDIPNSITKVTAACFEPALDYIVVKMPRWDMKKFRRIDRVIGSEMKSVGEVMAIGRSFQEAIQKAVRMLDTGMDGITAKVDIEDVRKELKNPTDVRLFAIAEAIKQGISREEIAGITKIDNWFLAKLESIITIEKRLLEEKLTPELLMQAKKHGCSDKKIASLAQMQEDAVRVMRKKNNIVPFIKQIDTLAGEFPAKTNYLYLTYHGQEHDITFKEKKKIMVLGSGAYRIGSSVEFDWCAVNCVKTLRELGYFTILINYNPETVSTDYDETDKLYFDELSSETVRDIYELESPEGIIVSMGGQIPTNLISGIKDHVKILGTRPEHIDNAEDRNKFSKLLDALEIDQPEWKELTTTEDALEFAAAVDYPVLIRPSYVLSGAAMNVAFDEKALKEYLTLATEVSKEHPVVISKFILNAKEIEIDAVASKGEIICYAISEHIENAGVHSGDATMVLPAQKLYLETTRRIKAIARNIARALFITGPFNIQFLAKDNNIRVIECNLRASRSFPFVSKVYKLNFVEVATKAIMGRAVKRVDKAVFDLDYVGVKAPQFSFQRLKGVDPTASVEMASTGEVACIGDSLGDALLKSLEATGLMIPEKFILLSISGIQNRTKFLPEAKRLIDQGYILYATNNTYNFLRRYNVPSILVTKPTAPSVVRRAFSRLNAKPDVLSLIREKRCELVISIPDELDPNHHEDKYLIRRHAIDFSVSLITNIQVAILFVQSLQERKHLSIKAWDEYM